MAALAAVRGGLWACALVAAGGGAAAAADTFAPPQGCTLQMTVQDLSCTVAQHYTCAADPRGDQRVAYFDAGGLGSLTRVDAEGRWVETVTGDDIDRLQPGAVDDASLTQLLRTGRDDFDFWTVSDNGERFHFQGHDELTGETRRIDGVPLLVTRFEMRMSDASGTNTALHSGSQFVSRDHHRFYGGIETVRWPDGKAESDDSTPVRFIGPGKPGFGTTEPQYGCDAQMAGGFAPFARAALARGADVRPLARAAGGGA